MLQGKARLKEQGSFRERKAARIAKGPVKYEFNVYLDSWRFPRELIATFSSRKEAEKFAFEQRGPIVGYSSAVRIIGELHPRDFKYMYVNSDDFKIDRTEVTE